mgnify:CR=1 FL=1
MRFSKQTGMLSESMEDGAYRPCAACARPRSFAKLETRDSKFDVEDAKRGFGMRTPSHEISKQTGMLSDSMEGGVYRPCTACARPRYFARKPAGYCLGRLSDVTASTARPRVRAGEAAAFRASDSEWASISTYLTMLPPESGREAGSGGGEGG